MTPTYLPTIHPPRFKQLRAVLLTDSSAAACAGQLAGCYAVHQLGHGWQPAAELAARICTLLHVAAPLPPGGSDAAPALAAVLAAAGQLQPRAAAGQEGGPEEEEEQEGDDVVDMVLLALDAANAPVLSSTGKQDSSTHDLPGAGSNAAPSSSMAALEWADDLVQQLNQMPGFRETVLLTLVVGPGQQPCMEQPLLVYNQPLLQPGQRQTDTQAAVGAAGSGAGPQAAAAGTAARAAAAVANCLPVRRPAQSYQFAGLDRIAVAAHHPAIVVHRLPAVIRQAAAGIGEVQHALRLTGCMHDHAPTCCNMPFLNPLVVDLLSPPRVDSARKLDLAHICLQGAAGCILAERLLPEVSYKLGRAPKYGA